MTNQPLETATTTPAQTSDAPAQGKRKGGKAGRPSLSGSDKGGKSSPQIAFRVNPTLRQKAQQVAEGEGMNVSQLGRKALKEYLAKK
jgi:hypothetical protein